MKLSNCYFGVLYLLAVSAITGRALAEPAAATTAPAATPSPAPVAKPIESKPRPLVELGFFGGLFFPASDHSLVGRDHVHEPYKSPAVDLGARAAFLPIEFGGVEIEGAAMPDKTDSGAKGGFWAARAHVIGQLPMGDWTPFLLVGGGALGAGSTTNGTDADSAFHFGVGTKLSLDDFLALRLDLRDTMSHKFGSSGSVATNSPEILLGLAFKIGPEPKHAAAPAPVVDSDGDGLPDDKDKCPHEAAKTEDGCPIRDSDADGVPDTIDACPTEAGPKPCGCPFHDRDGDKVIDELDKCPDQPGPIEGCPDPDADRDGIPVPADKCPNEPETRNGFQDDDGCPDELPQKIKQFTGVIQGIEFDRGKDTIRPVSTPVLDGAVAVLTEYPALRLLISGYTDSDGNREKNIDLSKRRADSVKAYFVSKGVDSSRIETRGVGPDEPIGDNKTAAGKQKNRRIEFKLLEQAPAAKPEPQP